MTHMKSRTFTPASAAVMSIAPVTADARRLARRGRAVAEDLAIVLADRRRAAAGGERRRREARERAGVAHRRAEHPACGTSSASSRARRAARSRRPRRWSRPARSGDRAASAASSSSAFVRVRVKSAMTRFTRSNSSSGSRPVEEQLRVRRSSPCRASPRRSRPRRGSSP